MIKDIFVDSETTVVSESYAVIYAPRTNRKRFPENCVTIFANASGALVNANNEQNYYAAKVIGPSRSSEGLMLYYLVEWLDT